MLLASLVTTVLVAGIEVWLIGYAGRLIDLLAATPTNVVWQRHGGELLAAACGSGMVGGVVDAFSNIDTLKLFAGRDSVSADFRGGLEDTRQTLFRTRQIEVSVNAVMTLLERAMLVGYAMLLFTEGAATLGTIGAAIALSLRITTLAEWMLDAVWAIFTRVGRLHDALGTVARPIDMPEAPNAPALRVHGGDIRIEDVRHRYGHAPGGAGDGLDGVSLNVEPGEKVALVGRSGAGKSTLVNLMLRFHELEGGRIAIDGQDIRTVSQDSLRAAIAMVSQQSSLLHRSVRDNIAIGRPDATPEAIERAARDRSRHGETALGGGAMKH